MPDFFNPYAFVPPWPRRGDVSELRDRPPERLGRLHEKRWTGRLWLRITAVTPLLITEQGRGEGGLAERGTRCVAGTALLASTSVKGSVRSEFEAVTGSRYGVFDGHKPRLGHRSSTRDSSDLAPVRITNVEGERQALPLDGMEPPSGSHLAVLKAAWVPRYGSRVISPWPAGITHGTMCEAWVVLMRRQSRRDRDKPWVDNFLYWRVLAVWPDRTPEPDKPDTRNESSQSAKRRHLVEDPKPVLVRGFYVHTNRNVENKHDERLFFHPALRRDSGIRLPRPIPLHEPAITGWSDLLASYHAAHTKEDIHERRRPDGSRADASEYLPPARRGKRDRPAWSRHLALKEDKDLETLMDLPVGTLCYAKLRTADDGRKQVEALYPVALSRVLDDVSPAALAEQAKLAPAGGRKELSPADRLFGWVPPTRQTGQEVGKPETRALRGRVRFGPVRTIQAEVERINRGLAVLGAPRPTQVLFYAAATPAGDPLRTTPGRQDRDGYHPGQGLRGRKVYPHQPGVDWDSRTGQQWLRHGTGLPEGDEPAVDTQNARLLDWVRTGAVFEVDLYLEDLDPVELGALLYVLRGRRDGPPTRHHKLGGGTPLGFGSVSYEVLAEESELADGTAWQSYFALDDGAAGPVTTTSDQLDALADEFVRRVAPGGRLPRHLAAYENALAGFPHGTPVRYPSDPGNPNSDRDRYEWFVANKGPEGQRKPLGRLESDGLAELTLPTDPRQPTDPGRPGNQGRPQRGRGRR